MATIAMVRDAARHARLLTMRILVLAVRLSAAERLVYQVFSGVWPYPD
jgi:hypothetical protein